MGWLDNKHSVSEEKAERMQAEEYLKILEQRIKNGKSINFEVDKDFDFDTIYEFEILFISNETRSTDYYTDTYKIAKPTNIKGYVYRLIFLSDSFMSKYKLNYNDSIMKSPLSPSFEESLLLMLDFDPDFYRISSISETSITIGLQEFYDKDGHISNSELWKIYCSNANHISGKYKSENDVENAYKKAEEEFKKKPYRRHFNFTPFAEKDNGDIREVFYMIPLNTSN